MQCIFEQSNSTQPRLSLLKRSPPTQEKLEKTYAGVFAAMKKEIGSCPSVHVWMKQEYGTPQKRQDLALSLCNLGTKCRGCLGLGFSAQRASQLFCSEPQLQSLLSIFYQLVINTFLSTVYQLFFISFLSICLSTCYQLVFNFYQLFINFFLNFCQHCIKFYLLDLRRDNIHKIMCSKKGNQTDKYNWRSCSSL